jgi:hypothetical protein
LTLSSAAATRRASPAFVFQHAFSLDTAATT